MRTPIVSWAGFLTRMVDLPQPKISVKNFSNARSSVYVALTMIVTAILIGGEEATK